MNRDQVFISYSHADSEWLKRLQTMLAPLQRQGALDVWADTRIQPGQLWKEEIEKALARAKVAVLLVSPDFLASEFIARHEFPTLLEAASKEGLIIFWVPVRHSLYEETDIARYQAAYDPRTPLSTLTAAEQDAALVQIAKKLRAVKPPTSPSKPPQPPEPPPQPSLERPERPERPVLFTRLRIILVLVILGGTGLYYFGREFYQTYIATSAVAKEAVAKEAVAKEVGAKEFHDTLKDGSPGPEMVVIPAGIFLMGSPENEGSHDDDEHQHSVEIKQNFAIGKTEVTVGQFRRFVEATSYRTEAEAAGGCYAWNGKAWQQDADKNWLNPGFKQDDQHPVVCVSWNDALEYTKWLSKQTSQKYRLPTEAEWEYAARAGTPTPFSFGATISTEQANYDGNYTYGGGQKGVYRQKTVQVGQFLANAWGLHDMHGNVWEWTCSEYDKDYGGAELRCVSDPDGGPGGEAPWSPQISNTHRRIRLLKVSVEDRQQVGGF
jgi:formylglycine-generating enzyme required for sulfatase activity